MKIDVKKQPKSQVKITIETDAKETEKYYQQALDHIRKDLRVPGFRPGKVDDETILSRLGRSRVINIMLDIALPQLYQEAVVKNDLQPVARASSEIESQEPIKVTFISDVMPEITLKKYDKIKVKLKPKKVEKKEVDGTMENLLKAYGESKATGKAAKKGDRMEIDFEGSVDGIKSKHLTSKHFPVVLGNSNLIPGFEDHLIGMKEGEEKSFDITFPKDYSAKQFADKKATFEIKVNRVEEIVAAKLDEEFVQKISQGNLKTPDELKADIEKNIQAQHDQEAKVQAEDEALAKLEKLVEGEVPESFVQDEVDFMRRTIEDDCKRKNMTLEDFLKARETTLEKLYKEWEPDARKRVRTRLGLLEIAKQVNIEITEKELEEACKGHAHEHKKEDESRHKNMIAAQIRMRKSIDHLLELATK